MIEKISVTNFKCHAHTEIELGRVTALVGPNGCGKTSILQAIHCLTELISRPLDKVFTGEQSPDALVKKGSAAFEIGVSGANLYPEAENDADVYAWRIAIEIAAARWFARVRWDEVVGEKDKTSFLKAEQSIQDVAKSAETEIGDSIYFQASLEKLKTPSYPESLPLQIMPDGSGLASAVASLKTVDDEKFREIEDALRVIVPIIKRVKARRVQMTLHEREIISINETRIPYDRPREVVGDELIFDTTSANNVPSYAMSDGTLLVLGILTLIYGHSSPQLILLDDIEAGLHPLAQRRLMNMLKEFAKTQNRQILLTTHSPYIVDELEAEDVWAMAIDQQGVSHCKRLSDHADAKRMLEVLTTGEFLGAEGEEWVIDEPAMEAQVHG